MNYSGLENSKEIWNNSSRFRIKQKVRMPNIGSVHIAAPALCSKALQRGHCVSTQQVLMRLRIHWRLVDEIFIQLFIAGSWSEKPRSNRYGGCHIDRVGFRRNSHPEYQPELKLIAANPYIAGLSPNSASSRRCPHVQRHGKQDRLSAPARESERFHLKMLHGGWWVSPRPGFSSYLLFEIRLEGNYSESGQIVVQMMDKTCQRNV